MSSEDSGGQPGFLDRRVSRRDVLKGAAVVIAGGAIGPVVAGCGGSTTTTTAGTAAARGPRPRSTAAGGGSAAKPGGHLRVAAGAGSAKEDLNIHAPALDHAVDGHALQPVRLAARVRRGGRPRHGARRRALAQRRRDAVHGQAQVRPRVPRRHAGQRGRRGLQLRADLGPQEPWTRGQAVARACSPAAPRRSTTSPCASS